MLPPVSLAHPLDGGEAVAVTRSLDATAAEMGADGVMWRRLFGAIAAHWEDAIDDLLAPFHIPRHPLLYGAYALPMVAPAALLAKTLFRGERARAVFAGMAGHSVLPLERAPTAAFGLLFTCWRRPWAGRWPKAAPSRLPMRWCAMPTPWAST